MANGDGKGRSAVVRRVDVDEEKVLARVLAHSSWRMYDLVGVWEAGQWTVFRCEIERQSRSGKGRRESNLAGRSIIRNAEAQGCGQRFSGAVEVPFFRTQVPCACCIQEQISVFNKRPVLQLDERAHMQTSTGECQSCRRLCITGERVATSPVGGLSGLPPMGRTPAASTRTRFSPHGHGEVRSWPREGGGGLAIALETHLPAQTRPAVAPAKIVEESVGEVL